MAMMRTETKDFPKIAKQYGKLDDVDGNVQLENHLQFYSISGTDQVNPVEIIRLGLPPPLCDRRW